MRRKQEPRSKRSPKLICVLAFNVISFSHGISWLFRSQVLDTASPGTLVSAFNSSVFAFTSDVESSESTVQLAKSKELPCS